MLSMYLFSKYNFLKKYYVIDGYEFINIIMRIPSRQVFVLLTIFDRSISVYFFVSFIISYWAQISMNYTLPHTLMVTLLLSLIHIFLRKEWAWIGKNCTPGQFYHYTFTFRDDNNEYQDHMDISKCIPSIKISSLSLMDSLKEETTLDFSKFIKRKRKDIKVLLLLLYYILFNFVVSLSKRKKGLYIFLSNILNLYCFLNKCLC